MSLINLFLQKRRMHESQHGIIMLIAAYVLSIFMLIMGSDVFYNINSEAAGINKTTDEETQEKINKDLPVLPSAESTALLIQSKLQRPFGLAEVSNTGLGSYGTAEAYGSRTAALAPGSTHSAAALGSVSGVIADEDVTGFIDNEVSEEGGNVVTLAALA